MCLLCKPSAALCTDQGFSAGVKGDLEALCRYFHAYRIDHVLGFFRIWEIPGDCVTGLLGYFRPSVPIARSELDSRGIWDIDRQAVC